jgi:hypothetical protein
VLKDVSITIDHLCPLEDKGCKDMNLCIVVVIHRYAQSYNAFIELSNSLI